MTSRRIDSKMTAQLLPLPLPTTCPAIPKSVDEIYSFRTENPRRSDATWRPPGGDRKEKWRDSLPLSSVFDSDRIENTIAGLRQRTIPDMHCPALLGRRYIGCDEEALSGKRGWKSEGMAAAAAAVVTKRRTACTGAAEIDGTTGEEKHRGHRWVLEKVREMREEEEEGVGISTDFRVDPGDGTRCALRCLRRWSFLYRLIFLLLRERSTTGRGLQAPGRACVPAKTESISRRTIHCSALENLQIQFYFQMNSHR